MTIQELERELVSGQRRGIPFNRPVQLEDHIRYLELSFKTMHLSGMGPFTEKCEKELENLTGVRNLLVTSASHALEMMANLLEISPGDEVILPSFTFVSTANAFLARGARLRFADNDEFGNIRIDEVERLLNPKTRAVVAVHYGGNSAPMTKLAEICRKAGVSLVEDAAQAIGALCDGRPLGTFGELACFSFHETKNINCGEGGSLLLNNPRHATRAEIIREKGTNRRNFLKGLVDKYTWVDWGSSYVLSDLNAALLYPQLNIFEEIQGKRRKLWNRYRELLEVALLERGARIMQTPVYNQPNGHLFAVIFQSQPERDHFISYMKERRIACAFHYVPLHSAPFFQSQMEGPLPECEKLSQTLVRLPIFHNLSEHEQGFVVDSVLTWLKRAVQ